MKRTFAVTLMMFLGLALAACGGATPPLGVTVWGGVVSQEEGRKYEATGTGPILVAATRGAGVSQERSPAGVRLQFSPSAAGSFLASGTDTRFVPVGPGTVEFWAETTDGKEKSPRLQVIIPKAAAPGAAAGATTPDGKPIQVRIGPDGQSVGVEVGPIDLEINTPNEPAPSTPRGRKAK